jgi:hypothetical protein
VSKRVSGCAGVQCTCTGVCHTMEFLWYLCVQYNCTKEHGCKQHSCFRVPDKHVPQSPILPSEHRWSWLQFHININSSFPAYLWFGASLLKVAPRIRRSSFWPSEVMRLRPSKRQLHFGPASHTTHILEALTHTFKTRSLKSFPTTIVLCLGWGSDS